MYEIKYLPIAREDLEGIINYISNTIKSPTAAMNLLSAFDKAIFRLSEFPYMYKTYNPIKRLEYEYRLLPINNYAIFYTIHDNTVEIHRIVYAKMDLKKLIK